MVIALLLVERQREAYRMVKALALNERQQQAYPF